MQGIKTKIKNWNWEKERFEIKINTTTQQPIDA
jgi:hypothetical protein